MPGEVTSGSRPGPVPGASRLHAAFEPAPHGWFQLVFVPTIPRSEERADMGHLGNTVERHVGARR